MTQNKVDKIDAGKVFEQLKNNEKKNIIPTRVGDHPKKLVIGSGTSFEGSSIKTENIEIYGRIESNIKSNIVYVGAAAEVFGSVICNQIEIHGKVNGSIDVNGKASIKKAAQVIGSIRYQLVSIEEGATVYADLHCTKADQSQLDKVSKLQKLIMGKKNVFGLNVVSSDKSESRDIKENVQDIEEKPKKKSSFFS
jgi:cytoskeletal protein CcmA (bactofilin family)